MLYFYLLPEDEVKSLQKQQEDVPPSTPSTPRRSRYRSESLRAVLERAEVEWTPRTPRRAARTTSQTPPLSPSFSAPVFTPFASGVGNPGLGISQGPSEPTPSTSSAAPPPSSQSQSSPAPFTPKSSSSRPRLSRPLSSQVSRKGSDSDSNPFSPDPQVTPKPQHDLAFFSALASNSRTPRSSEQDAFGPIRTASTSSPKRQSFAPQPPPPSSPARQAAGIRSPLKRSALSSPVRTPRASTSSSSLSQSPQPSVATPTNRHPIVPLPSRRRSVINQEQIPPVSTPSMTRSQTLESGLPESTTPKNSLSRSQSEQSPLSDILGGSKRKVESPAKLQEENVTKASNTPDIRRRASVQLSQSRSMLRQSLGVLGTSSNGATPTGTPLRSSSRSSRHSVQQSPVPASPLRDRKPPATTASPSRSSTTTTAAAAVAGGAKRKAVPSPTSHSKSGANGSSSASKEDMALKSVDQKKQLLGRHLDDVDGLLAKFQGFAVR